MGTLIRHGGMTYPGIFDSEGYFNYTGLIGGAMRYDIIDCTSSVLMMECAAVAQSAGFSESSRRDVFERLSLWDDTRPCKALICTRCKKTPFSMNTQILGIISRIPI